MSRIRDALTKAKQERATAGPLHPDANQSPSPEVAGAPVTKTIPYSESAVQRYHIISPYFDKHDIIEHFRLLRTKILTETQTQDHRNILITSTMRGEGKTFVAANLAITFAREVDQTVLLVDVNLKNPSLLKVFGIETELGLTDYLMHDVPLSDLLVRPGIEKLTLLPAGKPAGNSAELLRSRKMKELVREMKHRYANRYIFFDAPPILQSVDAMALSAYVDKTLVVVEAGAVSPAKLTEALGHLESDSILGTVINKKSD